MDKRRQERVNAEIQKVLAEAIRTMQDPNLSALTTVTEVKVSADLSYCDVYVSLYGDENERKQAFATLEKAEGYLKQHIAKEINLRLVPAIRLHEDTSLENASKVNALLKSIQEEKDQSNGQDNL